MDWLINHLIRIFRPRVGWTRALTGAAAVLCVPFAADSSSLDLPSGPFFWAAMVGFIAGLRLASDDVAAPARRRSPDNRRWKLLWALRLARGGLLLALALALGLVFVLPVDGALPPLSLFLQDAGAWVEWAGRMWRESTIAIPLPSTVPPDSRTAAFLAESLPRYWRDLSNAPTAGEPGARLLAATFGVGLTWAGAIAFGWSLPRGKAPLAWSLAILLPLLLITIFGGGAGVWLVFGLGLLLLLAAVSSYGQRETVWDRRGTDFSRELRADVFVWGGLLIGAVLLLALIVPAWLGNPFAVGVWGDVEPPSGLAALEGETGSSYRPRPPARVGLSSLPGLPMGVSIEQGPSDQVALRIQVQQPLPDTPWPHYWRARLFNIYSGRGWTTDARVTAQALIELPDEPIAGMFVQTIEDARPDRRILVGMPNVIAADVQTTVEQLPNGVVTALTVDPSTSRYRVLSSPQEQAEPPDPNRPPADLSAFLALPNLPPRVGEMARAVAGGAPTDYAKALALESYLRELRYSYQVAPLPGDGDAVDQFLFEMRQGYCTYYASSMAVMARILGIPARVATGYATGDYDPAARVYTVYENAAHAWPELYIDGRWMPFEPTPIRPLPARASGTQPPPAPVIVPAAAPVPESTRGPLIWLAVLLIFTLLGIGGWWVGYRPAPAPLVIQIQRRLEDLGRRLGVTWPAGATLHEYGTLIAPRLKQAAGALESLIALVERARYGGRALTDAEESRLNDAWRSLREAADRRR